MQAAISVDFTWLRDWDLTVLTPPRPANGALAVFTAGIVPTRSYTVELRARARKSLSLPLKRDSGGRGNRDGSGAEDIRVPHNCELPWCFIAPRLTLGSHANLRSGAARHRGRGSASNLAAYRPALRAPVGWIEASRQRRRGRRGWPDRERDR